MVRGYSRSKQHPRKKLDFFVFNNIAYPKFAKAYALQKHFEIKFFFILVASRLNKADSSIKLNKSNFYIED